MKIPFNSPARKWLIAGIAVVLAVLYVGVAAREFAASVAGRDPGLNWLKAAARLDPGNADYPNQLGRYYDLIARDPNTAVTYYQAAVQLNPHSARYWFDLASAYQVLGDVANQTIALERAIQADSMTPDVAWEAANLYLVQGASEKALREFRVVMANEPSLAASAIGLCWRINPDIDLLLRDAVPQTADANLAFLNLIERNVDLQLSKITPGKTETDAPPITPQLKAEVTAQIKKETAGTFKIWDALMQTHQPFEEHNAYDYIQFLVRFQEVDQAVKVWQQAATRFDHTAYLPTSSNLVVNGTFALPVLNNGFDWQHQKQSGIDLKFDDSVAHAGPRSLKITFDGPGINEAGIQQLVAVQPNTTYNFSGFYKDEKNTELEGAGGPHFTIQDMFNGKILYESDELRDADSWRSSRGEFTTDDSCKLVKLLVRRLPAGSPIRGKLWISDLRIVRKPS